jgi:eukaryotic-like serine/threonine-protein kinase
MPELMHRFSEGELVAANYRIQSIAGAGGMGVVYRALDLRLERTVALKFLPAKLSANRRDKERFLREARTASSLDHPNIGVIHGIEETGDGLTFIVMAFYEGVTLAERMCQCPLAVHESIRIASEMAAGLAEAHARRIVHRDIKPSNVMLTVSGAVKIVDFGLAREVSDKTASEGGLAGTLRYMSPEQAMGLQIDQRSDIWALGVVLAEMLTGRSPFDRETIPAIISAITKAPPEFAKPVHPALQPVLYRALAKDAGRRYASCGEFLADLNSAASHIPIGEPSTADAAVTAPPGSHAARPSAQMRRALSAASRAAGAPSPVIPWLVGALALLLTFAVTVAAVPALRRSAMGLLTHAPAVQHIAVLPFTTAGNDPGLNPLADGLMDSLAARLSNLDAGNQSLWVVPNSELRRLKVTGPEDARKLLGANLVVEGTVERAGSLIRITANLVDTKDLRQIGSAEVSDPAGNLSTLEDQTVSKLARLMKLSVPDGAVRSAGGSVNPAAYEDYLSALGYTHRYDKPGNLDLAIASLKKAVQTDSTFALGYAQLGEAYRLKYYGDKNSQWLDEALQSCQKAAELDNQLPGVFVTLAQIHDLKGNHDLALQEFHHTLGLDPKNAAALSGLALSYERSGRVADAEKSLQDAVAMRPDDWSQYNELGAFYDRQGKYPQAVAAYRQALEITPDNADLYSNLAAAYLDEGGRESQAEAERALKQSLALSPGYPAYANLGMLYLQEKRYAEAASVTEQALHINGNDYMVWNNLMLSYTGSKQPEKAATARSNAEALAEKAVELRPGDAIAHSTLATFYAGEKQQQKALSAIRTSLALAPDDPGVLSNVAEAYEFLGDRLQALKYMEKALEKGYGLDEVAMDPYLQSLISDPRFKAPGSKPARK